MNAFEAAAAFLEGSGSINHDEAEIGRILRRVGYDREDTPGRDLTEGGRTNAYAAKVLRVAARMSRIFELASPDAPGLAFCGGTADPMAYGLPATRFGSINVSGRGLTEEHAFLGCIGEAVEHVSQLEWGDEAVGEQPGRSALKMTDATVAAFEAQLAVANGQSIARWIVARCLTSGEVTHVPAALCIRESNRDKTKVSSLGTGCAAGETAAEATLSALLELVERDAAALWWIGGQRARPLSLEVLQSEPVAILRQLRQETRSRRTWLLDISTDVDVPCVAAVSINEADLGFACGLAARMTLAAAARTALLELCQMELANALVGLKLQAGGDGALAPIERARKRRIEEIDSARCELLFSIGAPAAADSAEAETIDSQIDGIVRRLEEKDLECFAVDLTRKAIGIPVVRVLAPGLESLPQRAPTKRLSRIIEKTGGGERYTLGIDLL